ncbi:MAG: hypothetical protein ACM3UX_00970 [Candidatus Woesearchaeota archaeon]
MPGQPPARTMLGVNGDSTADGRTNGRPLPRVMLVGGRLARSTLRPLGGVANRAVEAGMEVERRASERVLGSAEFERLLTSALESPRVQAALRNAVATDAFKQVVADFVDAGIVDVLLERLLTRPALWQLVDEVAASPAVTAAITQQGLGFADLVGEEARSRSRKADDWLERMARRLTRHRLEAASAQDAGGPGPL